LKEQKSKNRKQNCSLRFLLKLKHVDPFLSS
jgi:hypothetical protein